MLWVFETDSCSNRNLLNSINSILGEFFFSFNLRLSIFLMRLSPGLFYGDLRKLFGDGFCFGVNSENLGLASEERRLLGLVDFRLFYAGFERDLELSFGVESLEDFKIDLELLVGISSITALRSELSFF